MRPLCTADLLKLRWKYFQCREFPDGNRCERLSSSDFFSLPLCIAMQSGFEAIKCFYKHTMHIHKWPSDNFESCFTALGALKVPRHIHSITQRRQGWLPGTPFSSAAAASGAVRASLHCSAQRHLAEKGWDGWDDMDELSCTVWAANWKQMANYRGWHSVLML